MKMYVALLASCVILAEARFGFRSEDLASWDFPVAKEVQNDDCKYNCNNAGDPRNQCVGGQCSCAQGFGGSYCTCEGLCTPPFGTCNDDAAGTCTCLPGWKGRNCNCPVTCPDSRNWRCKTGDTIEERGCICRVDNLPWAVGKKCCPSQCNGLMSCPLDDGVCHCPTTNSYIPYGSTDDKYKCCAPYCQDPSGLCECRSTGCHVKATGVLAKSENDCKAPAPGSCQTHDSWQECSIVHWQGRCICAPGQSCTCKCWYGWAGGNGNYAQPGWDAGYKALYSDHCRNRCDWTHDYQPSYCSTCSEVNCPECNPVGSKKCAGTA